MQITTFGPSGSTGSSDQKDLLGGKGANLCEMAKLGLPVPPGFIIPCSASVAYAMSENSEEQDKFMEQIGTLVTQGISFINGILPGTLVSVRSGARVSMPGMMDTILNVGITPKTLPALIKKIGKRSALDSYRRLIQMYASVAMGVDMKLFDAKLDWVKEMDGAKLDSDLSEPALSSLCTAYLEIVEASGQKFPETVADQLKGAVQAVFSSWDNDRAQEYRKINNIPYEWGTAVVVQAMVFGNMNDKSCTGVLFTRNPSTGAAEVTGEFLVNAQGEDVVAGIRTPDPLIEMHKWNQPLFDELMETVGNLEIHYGDMQDVEFTVQDGTLYILQTRNGKRSAAAAFKVASDLCQGGVITEEEAFKRVTRDQLLYLMKDRIDPNFNQPALLTGIAAGGSVATGVAVFSAAAAINCTKPCILVTKETDPDDIGGMNASVAILTAMGGLTSHAAVVARGMNKACVVGATALTFKANKAMVGDSFGFNEGDVISLDGSTGKVWKGEVPMITGQVNAMVREIALGGLGQNSAEVLEVNPTMKFKDIDEAIDSLTSSSVFIKLAWVPLDLLQALGDLLLALKAKGKLTSLTVQVGGRAENFQWRTFNSMFGCANKDTSDTERQVSRLLDWPTQLRKMTTLTGNTQAEASTLLANGFKLSGTITTFEDLLTFEGPINIDPDTILEVFGSNQAYDKALEMVKTCLNKEFPKQANPQHWYQPLLEKQ